MASRFTLRPRDLVLVRWGIVGRRGDPQPDLVPSGLLWSRMNEAAD